MYTYLNMVNKGKKMNVSQDTLLARNFYIRLLVGKEYIITNCEDFKKFLINK